MLFSELLFLLNKSSNENSYCCIFFFLPLTCWLYYSKIWQLSLPRLHALTMSHLPQSKTCLQIHYIDVIKKGIPRWSNLKVVLAEIIFFRSTWYTAPLSWHLVSTSSQWFWLVTQSELSDSVQSHMWSKSENPLGSEEVKMQSIDFILFLKKTGKALHQAL